jgi:hypothetical protein
MRSLLFRLPALTLSGTRPDEELSAEKCFFSLYGVKKE